MPATMRESADYLLVLLGGIATLYIVCCWLYLAVVELIKAVKQWRKEKRETRKAGKGAKDA